MPCRKIINAVTRIYEEEGHAGRMHKVLLVVEVILLDAFTKLHYTHALNLILVFLFRQFSFLHSLYKYCL